MTRNLDYESAVKDYSRKAAYGELTLKKVSRLNWIPDIGYDDSNQWISVKNAIKGTRVDGSHLRSLLAKGIIEGKKIDGVWKIKLASYARWLEKGYKFNEHIPEPARYGRNWSKEEIRFLFSSATNDELADMLGRSSESIRVKRCRLGIPRINCDFINPYFVSPHAVTRYSQRIINIPARYIIWNIQDGLQKPRLLKMSKHEGATFYCKGRIKTLDFRAVVNKEPDREWASVITIKETTGDEI